MKLSATLLVCCLLVVLNAARVECRGKFHHMLVFGDSFADNGNLRKTDDIHRMSRQWHWPYGVYYNVSDDQILVPTGRFSNYMLQSDLIANMLGRPEAPPAYRLKAYRNGNPSGVTFAVGGAGVYETPHKVATLAEQVDNFESLINDGTIKKRRLDHSVALVAISGNDYERVHLFADMGFSSFGDIASFIGNVTTEIMTNVQRLQELGVQKILVNNLHPIGCTPSQSRQNSYGSCDHGGNMGTSVHNSNLQRKLGSMENVHIVDLYSAFTNIVNHATGEGSDLSKQFKHKLTPCCESFDPKGYCGEMGNGPEDFKYTLCDKPEKYFFWDDMHPTQTGWEAVMTQLEDPINEFLGMN